ncbi:MAG TPA: hypothetical protein VK545_09920 [Streptomyces sp.]|nr:hypothetical protein [Streptomyces sp.]
MTPDYDEGPCHCDYCDPGRLRDDRIETYYQGWGAREMAERIVELEDEIGADVDGLSTGMHADVAEAWAEIERLRDGRRALWALVRSGLRGRWEARQAARRYRLAWKSARRRAFLAGLRIELAERSRERRTACLVRAVEHANTHRRQRDRYRLAWLSARRRAADEANFGMEALELRDAEIRRLRATLDAARGATAPRLEFVGTADEGDALYRLAAK